MSRIRAVAGAALVLGLLVMPPAISNGQDPAPGDPGQATTGDSTDPFSQPAGGGQATGSGSGTQPGDGGQGDSSAANPPAIEVQQTATTSTSAGKRKQAAARFAASLTVSIGDNFYSPSSITIDVGDTVTWTNGGEAKHSATATDGSFDTGVLEPGDSGSVTFSKAGTFSYFCTIHGTVQSGTVTVASAGGGSGGGGGGGGKDKKGPSESSAVASSSAAGSSSSLPMTGSSVLPPLGVGLLLLVAGLGLRMRDSIGPS